MDLGLAPSQGESEFLSKQTAYEPVDKYAAKVQKHTNAVKWADPHGGETKPKLCIRDILYQLEGNVESVPGCAFRSTVLFSESPLPFLPLAESLVDRRNTRVENDSNDIDKSQSDTTPLA